MLDKRRNYEYNELRDEINLKYCNEDFFTVDKILCIIEDMSIRAYYDAAENHTKATINNDIIAVRRTRELLTKAVNTHIDNWNERFGNNETKTEEVKETEEPDEDDDLIW